MFHRSISITPLISIQLKQALPVVSRLALFVFVISSVNATQPNWVLSGTFLNAENAHAMFVDENGDELLLELGDDIQGCDLVDVLQGSARIQCSGKEYVLELRNSVGDVLLQAEYEKSLEQTKTVVLSKQEVAEYIEGKQRLVSEIGFLPLVEDQEVVGFTLSKIQPDTKAALLGLNNGDVIKAVNGVQASESELFMQTVQGLSDVPEVTVEVDRDGQLMAYTYVLE